MATLLSVDAQHTLRDMITLQMYLLSQSQQTPWLMFSRRIKKLGDTNNPHNDLVKSSVARELLDRGFIEGTSNRTFVVSKSGYQYHEREMKNFQLDPSS